MALPSTLVLHRGHIPAASRTALLEKLGIGFSVYREGHLKDMTGFWRSPTSEEEEKFKVLIDEIYDNFVRVVASGRGMEKERARELATGEIFTGRGAHERGLVDELGDFDMALDIAVELGRARRRPMWVRPKRPFFERLVGRVGGPTYDRGAGLGAGARSDGGDVLHGAA